MPVAGAPGARGAPVAPAAPGAPVLPVAPSCEPMDMRSILFVDELPGGKSEVTNIVTREHNGLKGHGWQIMFSEDTGGKSCSASAGVGGG